MGRKLPSIPTTSADVPKAIANILNPIRDAIEVRFLGARTRDSVVTVDDLIKLGLISEADITKLDN